MATYELVDARTGRTVERWPTEAAALETVRRMLDRGEVVAVAGLVLRLADRGREPVALASGAALAARARAAEAV
jgi:hypothetical protein